MEKAQDQPGDVPGQSAQKRGEEKARTPSPPASSAHPLEAADLTKPELEDPSDQEEHGTNDALMESFNG